jgi:hypothetical protein
LYNSINNIRGLLYAFYPGQESGNALADILFGDVNPSGKLPVTVPVIGALLPAWNDNIDNGLGGGYRWFDEKKYPVQFAFGHGLSYTTFEYSNLVISPQSVPFGSPVTVTVDVKNTGSMAGEEVVQLYLTHSNLIVTMPVKELKGFKRAALQPGETKSVSMTLTNDELYYFDEGSHMYEVEPGLKTIAVGTASDSLMLTGTFTVNEGAKKPDLRITNIKMVPPYPVKGEKVTFAAMVKNQGTGGTSEGSPVTVTFSVDGTAAAFATAYTKSIPSGGMAFIEADGGPNGTNLWNADSLGTHSVTASVDPENTIDECGEENNSQAAAMSVYTAPPVNIALNKKVTVSSMESPLLGGENAVDGNMSTRWSSGFSDPQFIIVDLGAVYDLTEIILYWESAYAKAYQVELSDGPTPYKIIFTESSSDGGIDKIPAAEKARYVKIYCTQRATEWGNSLYEIVVHSTVTSGVINGSGKNIPSDYALLQNYPNPFNPATTITYQIPEKNFVSLKVFDVLGKEVKTMVGEEKMPGTYSVILNGSRLSSGVYYYTLSSGSFLQTKKFILLK